MSAKRSAYQDDLYFRESWADAVTTAGGRLELLLQRLTVLAMKPDAVVGRRSGRALDYLADHGFRPLVGRTVTLDRHTMREIWRYDWSVYTSDRLAFSTLWYTSTPMLVFFVADTNAPQFSPASVRLGELKGLADPARRNPAHLRSCLNPPNRILNFVHVTDEPADMVREIGILWDRPHRRALWRELAARVVSGQAGDVRLEITDVERCHPAHDLDFDAALHRLHRDGLSAAHEARLRAATRDGQHLGWDEVSGMLPPAANRWDVITVASNVIAYERRGVSGLLPAVDLDSWS